jgi:hypothetical protein
MSFIKKHLKKLRGETQQSEATNGNGELSKGVGVSGSTTNGTSKTAPTTTGNTNGTLSRSVLGSIKEHIGGGTPQNGTPPVADSRRTSQDAVRAEKHRRSLDKQRVKIEEQKRQQLKRIESEAFMENGPEEMTKLYRPFSMNQSKHWNHEHRVLFKQLNFERKHP